MATKRKTDIKEIRVEVIEGMARREKFIRTTAMEVFYVPGSDLASMLFLKILLYLPRVP